MIEIFKITAIKMQRYRYKKIRVCGKNSIPFLNPRSLQSDDADL